jgi:hypothetical protein
MRWKGNDRVAAGCCKKRQVEVMAVFGVFITHFVTVFKEHYLCVRC